LVTDATSMCIGGLGEVWPMLPCLPVRLTRRGRGATLALHATGRRLGGSMYHYWDAPQVPLPRRQVLASAAALIAALVSTLLAQCSPQRRDPRDPGGT
jgi:hypothetical protein